MASGGHHLDKDVSGTDNELFYLKWHNFQKNVSKQFERLREDDDLVDITFACEGKQIRAHKLVLFACSPYFKQLLKANPCKHPVFYMNDVKFEILKSILEYMYLGEVHISNDNLKEFIRVAEGLKIRGLTKGKDTFIPTPPLQQTTTTTTSNGGGGNVVQHPPPSSSSVAHSMEHLDFDSDLSQQSSGPSAESTTKRIKLSECFEGIAAAAVNSVNATTNADHSHQHHHHHQQQQQQQQHVTHQQQQQQQALANSHLNLHHHHSTSLQQQQQQQNHAHQNHHQLTLSHHQQQQQQQTHHDHKSQRDKMQALEPKVEMVEFLESQAALTAAAAAVAAATAVHSAPPPAYCQMQPSLVISTSGSNAGGGGGGGGQEKATLSLACQPDISNATAALIEEGKLVQHHQQQQQIHQQQQQNSSSATNSNTSGWIETKQESTIDTSAIQDSTSTTANSSPTEKSSKPKKQANCLNPHPCPVCARLYSNVSNLRQHMRLIHNRTEVCCPLCQKNFNSQLYLKRHYTSVHGYPHGSLSISGTAGDGGGGGSGGGGGTGGSGGGTGTGRRSEGKGNNSSSSNNNNGGSAGSGAGQTNGGGGGGAAGGGAGQLSSSHGNTGWSLYEMDNSSCQ